MEYVPENEFHYRCKTCKHRVQISEKDVEACEHCGDVICGDELGDFCTDYYKEDKDSDAD